MVPVRILHVVGGMHAHGVQTWLMRVLRQIDRDKYQFDFLVSATSPCAYDKEIQELGGTVIAGPNPHRPLRYALCFGRMLREHGPYDVIHTHIYFFSGWVLLLAALHGIRSRIVHGHTDRRSIEGSASWSRKAYASAMRFFIRAFATEGFYCSTNAAASLFGSKWASNPKWHPMYCGIEMTAFRYRDSIQRGSSGLQIPEDAWVIGHVGRLDRPKNHDYLLQVFAEVRKRRSDAYLLLMGEGDLRPKLEEKARCLGIYDHVIFTGARNDIPNLLRDWVDVFCFPSQWEGLPVAVVEAQAAGVPCVVSDVVTNEVDLGIDRLYWMSLHAGADAWAEMIICADATSPKRQLTETECLELARFDIASNIDELCTTYSR